MDYEKAYKELIAKLRAARNDEFAAEDRFCDIIDSIVPGLGDSEDERIRKMLVEQMERWKKCAEDNNVEQDVKDASAAIAYLKKQKPKEKSKKPIIPEWSEEDEKMLTEIINSVNGFDAFTGIILQNSEQHEKKINWLKSLRHQPKVEWNEEDEEAYNNALDALYYKDCNDKDDVLSALKCLCDLIADKRKVIPPYQRWKPSEEQMAVLEIACKYEGVFTQGQLSMLLDLKEQLKKL